MRDLAKTGDGNMENESAKNLSGEKGIALFLVIWVLALLTVIVGEFCHAMRTEVNITRNFKEQTEAYYAARAGLMTAVVELIELETTPPKTVEVEETGLGVEENVDDEIDWRINVEIPDVPFGTNSFSVIIGNEAGKININEAQENLLRMMLNSFELSDDEKNVVVDSILDWRDKDSLHRANGAEDDYYKGLPEPYQAKDDDFESVEELLLVRGVTPEIFYGGLKEIVTVLTDDAAGPRTGNLRKKRRNSGTGGRVSSNKINLNFASPAMLGSLPRMTPDLVAAIVEFRKAKDITMPDLLEIVGAAVYADLSPYVTTASNAKSPFFTISSVGRAHDGQVSHRIRIVLKIDARSEKKFKILQWMDRG